MWVIVRSAESFGAHAAASLLAALRLQRRPYASLLIASFCDEPNRSILVALPLHAQNASQRGEQYCQPGAAKPQMAAFAHEYRAPPGWSVDGLALMAAGAIGVGATPESAPPLHIH